ncbi:hypothetical protein NDN13_10680 [Acinetobacter sp. C32I]|uniref:hypothetical protein n=1 Tax=Acinetobacter sp. C32I TaxID=2950074 RepID=UPI002036A475|nr:hypothetical protein [Acinetobacter sp. C32I]USA51974.1 hypothetical protein NDN13_10680 [Acinetobacter sp. C32I]
MNFLFAVFGTVIALIFSVVAQKIYFSLTSRYYSFEHSSGPFSDVYWMVVTFTPLLGAVFGWKYRSTKNKNLLWFFPIYFIVMYLFHWYSAVYAGYPFFS